MLSYSFIGPLNGRPSNKTGWAHASLDLQVSSNSCMQHREKSCNASSLPSICSTFMEELSDAADTLANATCHSLVIMDELGRVGGKNAHSNVDVLVCMCWCKGGGDCPSTCTPRGDAGVHVSVCRQCSLVYACWAEEDVPCTCAGVPGMLTGVCVLGGGGCALHVCRWLEMLTDVCMLGGGGCGLHMCWCICAGAPVVRNAHWCMHAGWRRMRIAHALGGAAIIKEGLCEALMSCQPLTVLRRNGFVC
eukprot:scaffold142481_cov23-Tisochrysis_lutea.AAC.1